MSEDTPSSLPHLNIQALRDLAAQADTAACTDCAELRAPGWESLSSIFDRHRLRRVGTLRDSEADQEPTVLEHHPGGTHSWSAEAPIAPAFFPYNRCDVWVCVRCARPFLRYTEYGGYYQDERIRPLAAQLLDAAQPS